MGGLLDSLSSAQSALTAYRIGLDVTGQNIANVNTPGYSRRTLTLAELPAVDHRSAGRGVELVNIGALRDTFIEARLGRESAGVASDTAMLDGLTEIEAAIGLPGSSIDARLTAFFDAFARFSVDVTSASARDSVVQESQALAREFGDLSLRLGQVQRHADGALRSSVDELNALSVKVAALNGEIARGGPEVEALRDERGLALTRMAELVNVSVITSSTGMVDVTLASGQALVVGATPYAVDVTSSPPLGFASLSISSVAVLPSALGGRIGGLTALRDTVVPGYQAQLDQLAYDVATGVNAVHQSGFDGNGNAGGPLFVAPAAVAGAAAALAVDPAVLADSALVAGSATGAAGDNAPARAIADLRDAAIANGSTATPIEAWAQFAYDVGSDVATARASSATRGQVVRQLERLRDQASGISLDEEAAHLMKYQRAYEASARYFTTIVDTIDTLLQMVR
jgi:flagellar hook-associated protein 1 FlgK